MGPTVHTHTHTLVVESFGTYSEGDVCVCGSAGNGTLTYYTTPRTNPLAAVDTLVTPSAAEHTRTVYTACRSKNGRPPPIPTHPRLNLSACLVLVILTRTHTYTYTYIYTCTHINSRIPSSFYYPPPTIPSVICHSLLFPLLLRESYLPFYFVILVILCIHTYIYICSTISL